MGTRGLHGLLCEFAIQKAGRSPSPTAPGTTCHRSSLMGGSLGLGQVAGLKPCPPPSQTAFRKGQLALVQEPVGQPGGRPWAWLLSPGAGQALHRWAHWPHSTWGAWCPSAAVCLWGPCGVQSAPGLLSHFSENGRKPQEHKEQNNIFIRKCACRLLRLPAGCQGALQCVEKVAPRMAANVARNVLARPGSPHTRR